MSKTKKILIVGLGALGIVVLALVIGIWRPGNKNSVIVDQTHSSPLEASDVQPRAAYRSRRDFAAAMSRVKKGMPAREVYELLGPPEDIRTQDDPRGITTAGTREVWRYGTAGHLTFPTLGCVAIDTDGDAQYMSGAGDPSCKPEDLPEEDLRRLLRLLDKAPSYDSGREFDPPALIRVVNELLPLGKEKALSVIEEYLRLCSFAEPTAEEGVFLVLRVLFEVPEEPGYMPRMRVGAPSPEEPKDPRRLPHFPLLLLDDVPLLLIGGYELGGRPEHPYSHVHYFREHGRLRTKPLVPPADPLVFFDRAWPSISWFYRSTNRDDWDENRGKTLLMNQLLCMVDTVYRRVDTVYRRSTDDYRYRIYARDDPDPVWREMVATVEKLEIQWDGQKNCYTFKDGTQIPEPSGRLHPREVWKLDGLDGDAAVLIERIDEQYVSVRVTWEGKSSATAEPLAVRIYPPNNKDRALAEFTRIAVQGKAGIRSFHNQVAIIKLKSGERLQAQVESKGETNFSPVYQP